LSSSREVAIVLFNDEISGGHIRCTLEWGNLQFIISRVEFITALFTPKVVQVRADAANLCEQRIAAIAEQVEIVPTRKRIAGTGYPLQAGHQAGEASS
jgi:hypothetical protein